MKTTITSAFAAAALIVTVSGTADATLITIGQATKNSSNFNLVWDNDSPFGSVVYLDYTNPADYWVNQVAWASNLDTSLTYSLNTGYNVTWNDGWRLPATVDGVNTYGTNGTAGYNITNSEFGHLYYSELHNNGEFNTSGVSQPGWGLSNKGNLSNLQSNYYWSGTENLAGSIPNRVWFFSTDNGFQDVCGSSTMLGLAVRSGQVSEVAPVPEPSTILLLGGGVSMLVGWQLRRRYL